MRCVDHQRRKWFPAPLVPTRGERAKRVAVVALPASNDPVARRLTFFQKVLARQLERGFDSFGSAGNEVNTVKIARSV